MSTKLFKSIAAVALVAFAASCAKEQTAAPLGGETEVTFNVASPVFQTKAIADGNTVDKVACCVYDSNGNLIENEISKTIDMTNGKATFSVRLVTGQTYSFIFWAYKASVENGWTSPYTFSAADKTVTVSYDNATSNDENRDAFYAYVEPFQITGALTQKVELKRPFAQINFGVEVDDITAAKAANSSLDVSKSKVTLTNLGNVLDLVKGTVTGEEKAEFTLGACPTVMSDPESLTGDVLEVNDKTYGYVAMNYVLVGKDSQTLTDATLWIADTNGNLIKEDGLKVTNVPLQGNYRTNVLGNLFTSAANFNVVVTPAFAKDVIKEIWDGQINEPKTSDDGSTYLITLPSELAWVAQQVNSGTLTFENKTVQLQNDIDLCNGAWTPIGGGGYSFKGTFDGQNYTISNLNVYSTNASDNLGLFGHGNNAYFRNFTIDGAKVISEVELGGSASCGVVLGDGYPYAELEGINVKNAVVASNHYVGGISNGYVKVTNCTVDNATLTASAVYTPGAETESKFSPNYDFGDKVGGIIGFIGESAVTISGCKVSNVIITGYRDLGGISGLGRDNITFDSNVIGDNVVINVDATYNYKDYTKKKDFCANNIAGRPSIEKNNTGTAQINYPEDITE